jgi:hypothetical protein
MVVGTTMGTSDERPALTRCFQNGAIKEKEAVV